MKAFVALLLLAALLHMPEARAQCAPGIPGAGNPECLPPDDANSPYYQGDRNRQPAEPQQPRAVWADRWGAIVIDGNTGQDGLVTDYPSKSKAVKAAMNACIANGGQQCKVEHVYANSCAAIAWGDTYFGTSSDIAEAQAQANAMQVCTAHTTGCKIAYSACSLPVRVQ